MMTIQKTDLSVSRINNLQEIVNEMGEKDHLRARMNGKSLTVYKKSDNSCISFNPFKNRGKKFETAKTFVRNVLAKEFHNNYEEAQKIIDSVMKGRSGGIKKTDLETMAQKAKERKEELAGIRTFDLGTRDVGIEKELTFTKSYSGEYNISMKTRNGDIPLRLNVNSDVISALRFLKVYKQNSSRLLETSSNELKLVPLEQENTARKSTRGRSSALPWMKTFLTNHFGKEAASEALKLLKDKTLISVDDFRLALNQAALVAAQTTDRETVRLSDILRNPKTVQVFNLHLEKELSPENLTFMASVDKYNEMCLDETTSTKDKQEFARAIYEEFIADRQGNQQANISYRTKRQLNKLFSTNPQNSKEPRWNKLDDKELKGVFETAKKEIVSLMEDPAQRFQTDVPK